MPGESIDIKGYTLTYENIDQYETESKTVVTTTLSVYNHGKLIGKLTPDKYFHRSYEQPVTEVAIRSTWREDLYVILAGWDVSSGKAAFHLIINPAVMWIWIGGGLLACGGIAALWGRRTPAQAIDHLVLSESESGNRTARPPVGEDQA